jgi:hypothetical protein
MEAQLQALLERLERATENLKDCKTDLLLFSEKYSEWKTIVDNAKAEALATKKVDGKNDTERKAQLAEMFASDNTKLGQLERDVNKARLALELNQIDMDEIRYTLRIYELMKG